MGGERTGIEEERERHVAAIIELCNYNFRRYCRGGGGENFPRVAKV